MLNSYGDAFDRLSGGILQMLLAIEGALNAVPWWAFIAAVIVLSLLLTRRVVLSVVLGALLVMVVGFGLWAPTMNTLAIVVTSVILALALGIPMGRWQPRCGR